MAEIRTENLTILFIDIAGFTATTGKQSRAQNAQLLQTFNNTLLPLIKRFGGWVVKSIGDALLITFRSPTDGMLCAMALQDAMHEYNLKVPQDERIRIRVAASLGEVRVTKKDIFGEPVNVSSRIEGITPADEIYLSEAVYLAMNKAEVPAQEVGFKELSGITGSIRIYSIPRFATPRLVPQDVQRGQQGNELLYPYGGMHQKKAGSSAGLQDRIATYARMANLPNDKRAGIIAGSALLGIVVLGLMFSSGPKENAIPTNERAQNVSEKSTPTNIALLAVSPTPTVQTTPAFDDWEEPAKKVEKTPAPTPVATLSERPSPTPIPATPQVSPSVTPATVVAAAFFNQTATAAPSTKPSDFLAIEMSAKGKPANSPETEAVAVNEVPKKSVVKAEKPTPVWTVIAAKSAYKAGKLSKPRYKQIIAQLDADYESKIRRLKEEYRAGRITRPTYDARAQVAKRAYRGD